MADLNSTAKISTALHPEFLDNDLKRKNDEQNYSYLANQVVDRGTLSLYYLIFGLFHKIIANVPLLNLLLIIPEAIGYIVNLVFAVKSSQPRKTKAANIIFLTAVYALFAVALIVPLVSAVVAAISYFASLLFFVGLLACTIKLAVDYAKFYKAQKTKTLCVDEDLNRLDKLTKVSKTTNLIYAATATFVSPVLFAGALVLSGAVLVAFSTIVVPVLATVMAVAIITVAVINIRNYVVKKRIKQKMVFKAIYDGTDCDAILGVDKSEIDNLIGQSKADKLPSKKLQASLQKLYQEAYDAKLKTILTPLYIKDDSKATQKNLAEFKVQLKKAVQGDSSARTYLMNNHLIATNTEAAVKDLNDRLSQLEVAKHLMTDPYSSSLFYCIHDIKAIVGREAKAMDPSNNCMGSLKIPEKKQGRFISSVMISYYYTKAFKATDDQDLKKKITSAYTLLKTQRKRNYYYILKAASLFTDIDDYTSTLNGKNTKPSLKSNLAKYISRSRLNTQLFKESMLAKLKTQPQAIAPRDVRPKLAPKSKSAIKKPPVTKSNPIAMIDSSSPLVTHPKRRSLSASSSSTPDSRSAGMARSAPAVRHESIGYSRT